MKKLLIAIGVVSVIAGVWTGLSARSGLYTTPNCSTDSIVKCGANNQAQLDARITSSAKALFKHYGISTNLSTGKKGTLKANGDIVVGGKVVATKGHVVGHTKRADSKPAAKVNGKQYYQRTAKSAFLGYDTPVFVFFNKDGSFRGAMANVCGNPVPATPVPPKKPPVPPKPPKPEPKPEYKCESLKVDKINRTSFRFSSTQSAKHATYKSTTYVVRDASGKVVKNSTSNTFNATEPGTYTVEARVTFTVKGQTKTVTDPKCKGSFTVKPEPVVKIPVCELETGKVIRINEKDFDSSKHSRDLADCDKPVMIPVCELDTGNIVEIDEKDFDDSKHSLDLADCDEPEVPEVPEVPETPEVPQELPETGLADNIVVSGFGLGSVIAATSYYVASRRNLLGQ